MKGGERPTPRRRRRARAGKPRARHGRDARRDRAHPAAVPAHPPASRRPTSYPMPSRSTTCTSRPTRSTTCTARSPTGSCSAAVDAGEVLYAVPGSPLVLERSVRYLVDDDRRRVHGPAGAVVPRRRLRATRHRSGRGRAAAHRRPRVRHRRGRRPGTAAGRPHPCEAGCCRTSSSPSRTRRGDEEVVILQRLGTPDEAIDAHDLGRARPQRSSPITSRRSTSRGWPRPSAAEYVRFHQLARTLREQCPWDIEQTHRSLHPLPDRGDLRARRRARGRSTPTTRPPTSISSRSSATCCTRSSSTPRSPNSRAGSRSPTWREACTTSSCVAIRTCSA